MSNVNKLKALFDKYEIAYLSEGENEEEKITIDADSYMMSLSKYGVSSNGTDDVMTKQNSELQSFWATLENELEGHGALSAMPNGGTKIEMWVTHKIHKPVGEH